jgi:hypothetical protein
MAIAEEALVNPFKRFVRDGWYSGARLQAGKWILRFVTVV